MRQGTGIIFITAVLIALGTSGSVCAQECTPDYVTMGAVLADADSMDDVFSAVWCGTANPSAIADDYAANLRLELNGTHWNDLFQREGDNVCRPLTFGNRLFNTAAFMEELWANRGNSSLWQQNGSRQWLRDYIYPDTTGYTNTCRLFATNSTNHVFATNPGDDGPIQLHLRFYWQRNVAQRAGVLVHENAHEHEGHLPNELCTAGGSCDWAFAQPNPWPLGNGTDQTAQTWNIWFLGEAVDTYRRDPADPEGRLAVINLGTVLQDPARGEICGYHPMLSPAARFAAVDTIQRKFRTHFAIPLPEAQFPAYALMQPTVDTLYDYGGNQYEVDRAWGARWICGHICDPADYDFAAGGRYACNEDHQPGNAERNLQRRLLCESVEAQIAQGVTEDEWGILKAGFGRPEHPGDIGCIRGYSGEYLDDYCERLKAGASDVRAIAGNWNIPDDPGYVNTDLLVSQCQWEYCADKFEPQWLTDAQAACYEWSDMSPPTCLHTLCGDLALIRVLHGVLSEEYFEAVHCRKTMLARFAQTELPELPAGGVCEEAYRTCRLDQEYEQWRAARSNGDCSLTPAAGTLMAAQDISPVPVPVPLPILSLPGLVIDSIRNLDYDAFQASFPGVAVDQCEARLSLCEASVERGASVVAEFLEASNIPERLLLPNVTPEGLPIDVLLPQVDVNVRRLAAVIVNGPDESGLTPEEAMRRLATIPEAMHSLSNQLGKDAYFALFGAEGRVPVFGALVVEQYAAPELKFDFALNPEQELLLPALNEVSSLRQRIAAPETALLIEQAATLAEQPVFYDFVRSVANTSDTGEINIVLDQLPQLAQ